MTIKSIEKDKSSERKVGEEMVVEDRVQAAEEEKSFAFRQKEAQKRRKKKKKTDRTLVATNFADLYKLTGETLGEGSYGKVMTCVNIFTGLEYAVKFIEKRPGFYSRSKVLKEIEIYHLCRGQQNIIQLIEYFEEQDMFYLVFEKINGGPLLDHIQARICFTEAEASAIVEDLAEAIKFLHNKGIAHRDLKPDNVLCVNSNSPCPVKLCDFDLCSQASIDISTPTLLTPVGSVEYMAPEVVDTFILDDDDEDDEETMLSYNKKCDVWSLGIIMYILLCGYAPFSGHCGSDCGWDRGESCPDCQERLFTNIKEGQVIFPDQHWSTISLEAKDLIQHMLVKDSSSRLDANQVLNHPWIVCGGSSNSLETPNNLRRQTSLKDLEDFASRAMAVNRAVEEEPNRTVEEEPSPASTTAPLPIPWQRGAFSFDLTPPGLSNCSLLQRRRRSREKMVRFTSIEELDTDLLMRAIC